MTAAELKLLAEMAKPDAYLWTPRNTSGYKTSEGRPVRLHVAWALRRAGLLGLDPTDTIKPYRWTITEAGRAALPVPK